MNFARISTRFGFVAAGMGVAISAGIIAGGSGSSLQAQDAKGAKEEKPAVEEREKPVGRVIKIDGETKQLTLDIHAQKGAETGKRYMVIREVKDAGEIIPSSIAWIEIVRVDRDDCLASIIENRGELGPQVGDLIFDRASPEAFRISKLATSKDVKAREELGRTRVKVARDVLDLTRAWSDNGSITHDRYIKASKNLMDAEKYVATSQDERRVAIVNHMKRMQSMVDRETNNWTIGLGMGPVLAINEAMYEQLNASILLSEFDESKDKK